MRNLLYIVFTFLFISSCKPGIPGDIIQPDQMALVLHDIHIVDAYLPGLHPDSVKPVAAAYYEGIYRKFGIDSALYARSMDYYYKNPKVLDEIYLKITTSLNKQKAVFVRADSLKNAKELKKIKLKLKADSAKAADSVKKVKTDLFKKAKADSVKKFKADSIKKAKNKTRLKKATTTKKASAAAKARQKRRAADALKKELPLNQFKKANP